MDHGPNSELLAALPMPGERFVNPMPPDLLAIPQKLLQLGRSVDALDYVRRHVDNGTAQVVFGPALTAQQLSDIYFRMGMSLAKQKLPSAALSALQRCIDLDADQLLARITAAEILQHLRRPAEAVNHYQELLNRRPDHPLALNNLAWLLSTSDEPSVRGPRRAIQLAERLCRLTNNRNPRALDTLATAYAANGRFADISMTELFLTSLRTC